MPACYAGRPLPLLSENWSFRGGNRTEDQRFPSPGAEAPRGTTASTKLLATGGAHHSASVLHLNIPAHQIGSDRSALKMSVQRAEAAKEPTFGPRSAQLLQGEIATVQALDAGAAAAVSALRTGGYAGVPANPEPPERVSATHGRICESAYGSYAAPRRPRCAWEYMRAPKIAQRTIAYVCAAHGRICGARCGYETCCCGLVAQPASGRKRQAHVQGNRQHPPPRPEVS